MYISKIKKPIAVLMVIVMAASVVLLFPGDVSAAPGDQWDLFNFVTGVTIEDPSTTPPTVMGPGSPTYTGQNYIFTITFAESPGLQLAYANTALTGNSPPPGSPAPTGWLEYELPAALTVSSPVPQSPIYFGSGTVRVGWYTISTTGLVQVWFDNVNNAGTPTPGNFIDNYTNVTFRLQITAQLLAGGGIDFGGGETVTVTPPEPPPPKLTVTKTSEYDANRERVYYSIKISASGNTVTNISFVDEPMIDGSRISNLPDNAFYGFRYSINDSTAFNPMIIRWPSENPAMFSYIFGSDVVLNPGDFITVFYYIDIPTLISNNSPPNSSPGLIQDPLEYNFTLTNTVTVMGDGGLHDTDDTTDNIRKTFPINKTGSVNDADPPDHLFPYIKWTIIAGPTTPAPTALTLPITDTLSSGLILPPDSEILITLYDAANNTIFDGNASELSNYFSSGTAPSTQFTFNIPAPGDPNPAGPIDPFGDIYSVKIVYDTEINSLPPDRPGLPPVVYENSVYYGDHGATGRLPFTPTAVPVNKVTSGICGNPTDGYYIDYTITVAVPAELLGQPLWIYDTLTRGGTGIANVPQNLTVTATPAAGSPPLGVPLYYTEPIITGTNNNEWRIYLGTNVAPAPYASPPGLPWWQWNFAVDLTVSYRYVLDQATVDFLKGGPSRSLQNSVYLINSTGDPILSGATTNNVGGKTVNDFWPVFKSGKASANPALFDYTVIINGAYSSRPNSLFQTPGLTPTDPVFSESFDARLSYVPGTFYIRDTGNNLFYAPGTGSDVIATTNGFSINLNTLWQYTSPPAPTDSGITGGTPIGTSPADPSWYTNRRNYEVHYQLILKNEFMGTGQSNLVNNAFIAVNQGECTFNSNATLSYNPPPIGKTITTDGSNVAHVEIVINPDGSIIFSDGSTPPPTQITAQDVLSDNMLLYLDNISVFTEPMIAGHWGGIWIPQPVTYNDGALWSVNVVDPYTFDFIIPNQQPVKIVYDALITLVPGEVADISNKITIYGQTGEDGKNNYQVNDTTAGATADSLNLRLFKSDSVNKINLPGATFTLYLANLADLGSPPYGITAPPKNIGGINFYPLITNVVTDNFGRAVFADPGINASFHLLFMLEEVSPPPGYTFKPQNPNPYENLTFFTVKPDINTTMLNNAQNSLNAGSAQGSGVVINQISDFITVENTPDSLGIDGSIRIWKLFTGLEDLTPAQIAEQLSGFIIVVTDPMAGVHSFGINDLLNTPGAVLTGLSSGTYFIQEENANINGYVEPRTNPQLPIRKHIDLGGSGEGEVLIQINNVYEKPLPNSLFVQKAFNFPPGTSAAEIRRCMQLLQNQNFMINITGPGFNETLSLVDALAGKTFENIQEGTYFFSEVNANIPGYDLGFTNFRSYILPTTAGPVNIQMVNTYTVPGITVPPAHFESLMIRKVVNFPAGTTDAQRQQYLQTLRDQDFKIIIDGPGNFHQEINLIDAMNSVTFLGVQDGTYFITEANAGLPGLNLTVTPPLPIRINILPTDTSTIVIDINNTYAPGPGGPSPQTGVSRNIIIPIVLLGVAGICIAGAEVYRRRFKKAKKQLF